MGEIKSTLDLVMEKTRHLTLSQEEKMAQKRTEVTKKLQGMLQKYHGNLLKKENLKKEVDNLKTDYDLNVDDILAKLLLNSLKLGQDNTTFTELLGEMFGLSFSGLETALQNFKNTVKSATKERLEQMKTDLYKKRLISGSAVVPNFEKDRRWLSTLGHIKAEYDEMMNKEKSALAKELSLDWNGSS